MYNEIVDFPESMTLKLLVIWVISDYIAVFIDSLDYDNSMKIYDNWLKNKIS